MAQKMLVALISFWLAFSISLAPVQARESRKLVIATATSGGTFYPVGVGLADLITDHLAKDYGISATAVHSAGSKENVGMLDKKEADLAILQALYGLWACQGDGPYQGNPIRNFSAVTMLWENVEHFVVLSEFAKTETMKDLEQFGRKFSIGQKGSGTEGSGRIILEALGIDPEKNMKLEHLGYMDSAKAMIDGDISGANIPAGPPASAITRLFETLGGSKVTILDFTLEQTREVEKQFPIWSPYTIKAGTYPGLNRNVRTMAQPNFLAVRNDLPEETVYLITKAIFENLDSLQKVHQATKAMDLNRAVLGLPVPLHPGAARFFKEKGVIR